MRKIWLGARKIARSTWEREVDSIIEPNGKAESKQADLAKDIVKKPQIAVLGYHKIGQPSASAWDTWFYIPEKIFERQLRFIAQSGWEVIDAARFLRGLNDPGCLPDRSVLLTFDDGYQSILCCALPHLKEFGFAAVIFVPTGLAGDLSRFDAGTNEPMEPICSWDELRELQHAGVSVESHGVSHCAFSTVDRSRLVLELESSRNAIMKELSANSVMLAFPYGDPGSDYHLTMKALVKAGYRCAFLYGGALQPLPVCDPYRIARVPMGRETELGQILT